MRRLVEIHTMRAKDRIAAAERRFLRKSSSHSITQIMAIGNKGTGVGSFIKGYDRRGGK
jgi:hypothetical protein